ncbi:MAG: acyltransferase family protein [Bacteroidota bacterium]
MTKKIRRYDLDWLRVIVFGLLIFYHVGMFFVPWDWHIKNPETYDALRYPMWFVNQWRLPILFVISGMGTRFALSWRSGKQYRLERFKRLSIPLLVGMLLVVPPQVYVERLSTGDFVGNYWSYYASTAFEGVYPEGNISWHHLWFLPYLLIYSLLLSPVFIYLRNHPEASFLHWIRKLIRQNYGFYWFVFPLFLAEALLEPFFPVTHALIGDWFTIINFLILFFYGFLFIAIGETFWQQLDYIKSKALLLGLLGFALLLFITHFFEDNIYIHFTEALIKVVNSWSWILALVGYAAVYLNRSSRSLRYLNEAVYPFYIFHQTITIIIAYYLLDVNWSFLPKFLLLVLGTFLGSWLLFEITRRIRWIRPLFGMKTASHTT